MPWRLIKIMFNDESKPFRTTPMVMMVMDGDGDEGDGDGNDNV